MRLYGIEGKLQPPPSFFLQGLNGKKFAYKGGVFYEEISAEMGEFDEKHESLSYVYELSDEELLEAYDVSAMSEE